VGKNEDGEEVEGGLVVETDIRPAGASGRPPKLNERQLCVINALRKEAFSSKKWDFSIDDFNDLCMKCGAIDHNAPEGTVRRLKHDLRMQLANKNLITVTGDVVRLVILS
jgi:hypothetical protein